jgi:hypothetical protein
MRRHHHANSLSCAFHIRYGPGRFDAKAVRRTGAAVEEWAEEAMGAATEAVEVELAGCRSAEA